MAANISGMSVKELRQELTTYGIDISGCVEKAELVAKLSAHIESLPAKEESEVVSQWSKPQMKGFLEKTAVESKKNTKKRYFVLVGNFLMYYENDQSNIFHPKGVWCVDDTRRGLFKRKGLEKNQACLLRGTRELVITAPSFEELEKWHRALAEATNFTAKGYADLLSMSKLQKENLESRLEAAVLDAETTRVKLKQEREEKARYMVEQDSSKIELEEQMKAIADKEAQVQQLQDGQATSEAELLAEKEKVAAELKQTVETLKQELHKEIEARTEAEMMKEAEIRSRLEAEDAAAAQKAAAQEIEARRAEAEAAQAAKAELTVKEEMQAVNQAIGTLCKKLKGDGQASPEFTLLYAHLMTTRAKLVHAIDKIDK